MSDFTNKNLQSNISAFKNEGSAQSPTKQKKLVTPGLDPLVNEHGISINKNDIEVAKDAKKHVEEVSKLYKTIPANIVNENNG